MVDANARSLSQAPLWRITLLGGLSAAGSGTVIDRFPTRMTAALLAYLAFYRDRVHTRESLIDLLWPDADYDAARDRLTQALVWLRPRLEPEGVGRGTVLLSTRLTVGLSHDLVTTDVEEFAACLNAVRRDEPPVRRAETLARAVEIYRGELLPDQYGDWVLGERHPLQEAFLSALRELVAFHEEADDIERALGYARRAVTVDPLREEAQADLIRLLASSGQRTAALRQFQQFREQMGRELEAEPSPALRELAEQIRREGETAAPLSVSTAVATRHSLLPLPVLPVPLTRLFGRETEIEQSIALLKADGTRLVTLTGSGGAGKTRLALAIASRLRKSGEAVAFVPLADLNDARTIPSAIAGILRPKDPPGESPRERIIETLATATASGAPFTLVLDNLEHLIEKAAPLVRELLISVPDLTVLVTSRQRLGLDGEREAPVRSLPLPPDPEALESIRSSPSVQLFLDRAQTVRPDFAITPENAEAVARICARLDGLPLAIELCAAWAQTLTPAQMLEKLDRRFDLLVSRRTDITPRHRTLRAATEYSYVQLPGDLQRLFRRLSLFRGGWTLEAAEAVCAEETEGGAASAIWTLLGGLTSLRERSLIVADEVATGITDSGTEMRYRMLETLREFAGEQLSYADRAARRRLHAEYYRALAEQASVGIAGHESKRWLTRLDIEQENLRTALAWCLEAGQIAFGLRLAEAMGAYWAMRGPMAEGARWLQELLAKADDSPEPIPAAVHAGALRTLGHLLWSQADYEAARAVHESALALFRDAGEAVGIAESLYYLGITFYRQRAYDAARAALEESLAISREIGDRAGIGRVLLNLGNIAYERQQYAEGRDWFQQSYDIWRELGNHKRMADALNNLGLIAQSFRDLDESARLFQEALALYREQTDHYGTTFVLANLGTVAFQQGNRARAHALLTEGLKLASELGHRYILVHYLLQLGLVESGEGHAARSVALIAAAHRLSQLVRVSPGMAGADGYDEAIAANRAALGEIGYERAWLWGESASPVQIVALALGEDEPG